MANELEHGKAGEHLVCADLILNGHRAFLADAGCPFDVVAVTPAGELRRIQVRATRQPVLWARGSKQVDPVYRFSLLRGKGGNRRRPDQVDAFAFVALDIRQVAYLGVDVLKRNGRLIGLIEFRPPGSTTDRRYLGGTVRPCGVKLMDGFRTL